MRSWRRLWVGLLLVTVFTLPGCITPAPPLPTVEWDTLEDARQILIDRQNAIESVQAQLKLKITSPPPESETNTLDAALVMRGDDRFRLRAWKLNQTIFDLTVTPDGTFIMANEEMKKKAPEAEQDLAGLADRLGALLRGPDYADATIRRSLGKRGTADEDNLVLNWGPTTRADFSATFDAETLGLRYAYVTPQARNHRVTLGTVQTTYGENIWFRTVTAVGDFGRVEMTFRDVELNGELNPRAFRPPRRAVRVEDLATSSQVENASP